MALDLGGAEHIPPDSVPHCWWPAARISSVATEILPALIYFFGFFIRAPPFMLTSVVESGAHPRCPGG